MALKKGDRVEIGNTTFNGQVIVEGIATIVGPAGPRDQYIVHFDGDPKGETYSRFCQEENKTETIAGRRP